MKARKVLLMLAALALVLGGTSGCWVDNKRVIDKEETSSFRIEGTSWYGFCQGRNAFIYVPGKTDSDADELEAVVYDDHRCIGTVTPGATPGASGKPDADPDGIVDDNDND
jgi:hypothetical protein